MAALTPYHTKAEKKAIFTKCVFFDSETEVQVFLDNLDDGKFDGAGMSFRGMTRASYKLYSRLQQSCLDPKLISPHPDPKILVQEILDAGFQKGVEGTLLSNGARDDLAMLSYLQHHGCPTPFLDFTTDVRVALYFATKEPKEPIAGSALEDYFSIYVFHEKIPNAINLGLENAWHDFSYGQREEAARWFRSYEMNSLQDTLIFHPEWIERVYGEGVVNLSTSERFRRQKGLFAMNNTADLPFPEAIHAFVDSLTQEERERLSVRSWINSLNIHRDHVDVVKDWLKREEPPMIKEHLLPERDEHNWVKELFQAVLKRAFEGRLV